MTTYSLDGIEGTLFDENDWSDAMGEETPMEWDDFLDERDGDELEGE